MRHRLFVPLLLIIATSSIFITVVGYEFVNWDDNLFILENRFFNPPTIENALHFWKEPSRGLYIPLTATAWSLLAWISGFAPTEPYTLNPALFHAANLIVHVLGVLVVFGILRILLTRGFDQTTNYSDTTNFFKIEIAAGIGALIFAIHPLQVEPVAWISNLKDLMCGLFSLLAIWKYLDFAVASRDGDTSGKKNLHYILASAAFLLALFSKPAAVTVPVVAFVLDRWAIKRPFKKSVVSLSGWLIAAVLFAVIAKIAQQSDYVIVTTPIWTRPFIAGDALAFYIYKLIFPMQLGIDYGRTPDYVLHQWWGYATWLVPAALAAYILFVKKKEPWLVSIGIFAVSLLPVLGFTVFIFQNQSTVNDHYLYFPMLGISFCISWIIFTARSKAVITVIVSLTFFFAVRSYIQLPVWKNSFTLFTNALSVNPVSFISQNNMGNLLRTKGNPDKAINHFELALKIRPGQPDAHYNLGIAWKQKGEMDKAVFHFKEAINNRSDFAIAHNNLGIVLGMQGKIEKAAEHYRKALDVRPDYPSANFNLGVYLAKKGKLSEAIVLYKRALKLEPFNELTHGNIGVAYARKSEFDKAIIHFSEALKIKPDSDRIKKYLKMAREKQNR